MHHLPSRYIPCDGRLTAYAYFKSTLPVGGATPGSLRGTSQSGISIHAPRRGSDTSGYFLWSTSLIFQSTPPAGGATNTANGTKSRTSISIHAPRRGSDDAAVVPAVVHTKFQSTLPAGGATGVVCDWRRLMVFQSTLPVGGATSPRSLGCLRIPHFNPRSPWGERQATAKTV